LTFTYSIDTEYTGIDHEDEIFCPEQSRKIKKYLYNLVV